MAQISIEGEDLVIRVALNVKGSLSKSGKSMVLDTTNGFVRMASNYGALSIGLNVVTSDERWSGGRGNPKVAPPQLVKAGQPAPATAAVA